MQREPFQNASVTRPASINIPVVLVEDWLQQPPTTTLYVCGDNELDFQAVYTKIKSLLTHPPCAHRPSEDSWPCQPCEAAFLSKYWSSAAFILDYLADFLAVDNPLMQSIWFHLLDIWQEGATWLPCQAILDSSSTSPHSVHVYTKARWFLQECKETLDLINVTIFGTKRTDIQKESIIHPPSGDQSTVAGEYNTGPYLSGLKPWQQFLYEGSPGVAAHFPPPVDDDTPSLPKPTEPVRHIPMPAIALLQTHTSRARRLLADLHPNDPSPLYTFDQHSLHFPSTPHTDVHTYTSLSGTTITYHLTNGAPPISRYEGFGDPSMLIAKPQVLDFTLLDECVGSCKGVEAYEPISYAGGGDDGDMSEDEEEEAFDLWTVCETEGEGVVREEVEMAKGFGEMFEEWVCEEEF